MSGKNGKGSSVSSDSSESIVKSSVRYEVMTIGEVYDLVKAGLIHLDTAYQRSARPEWAKPEFVNNVFDSLLVRGWDWGRVSLTELSDGSYGALDGAHRMRFINGAIQGLVEWDGDKLIDSPDKMAAFLAVKLPFAIFPAMDDEEAGILFERLNGGIGVSPVEKLRHKVMPIVSDSEFRAAVAALLEILPTVAGRSARRESAEEILLQALAGSMGNRSYTGKENIAFLIGKGGEAVKAIPALCKRVDTFCEWIKADSENECKKALRKTFLNVALAGSLPSFSNIAKFLSTTGEDQDEWKSAGSAGSAGSAAVSARFAVMDKIRAGSFSQIAKPERKSTKKTDSGVVESSAASSAAVDPMAACFAPIRAAFGDKTYTGEEMQAVLDWIASESKGRDIKPSFVYVSMKSAKGEKSQIPNVEYLAESGKSRIHKPINAILMSAKK